MDAPFHSPLCRHSVRPAGGNVFAEWSKYDLVISLDSPLCRHPVWPDCGSVFAELDMSLYDPCPVTVVSFLPLIQQFTEPRQSKAKCIPFRHTSDWILTFSYCLCEFLTEQELGTGRSPDTDKADSFHGQIRWAKLNDFAPDIQDAMEQWALRPHARLVKEISVFAGYTSSFTNM